MTVLFCISKDFSLHRTEEKPATCPLTSFVLLVRGQYLSKLLMICKETTNSQTEVKRVMRTGQKLIHSETKNTGMLVINCTSN